MNFKENLLLHIKSRYPIIYIPTYEEERLEDDIAEVAGLLQPKREVQVWDYVNGYGGELGARRDPVGALDVIAKYERKKPGIYVLRDYHRMMEISGICRYLRNLSRQLKNINRTVIIVAPIVKIPMELEEDIVILDYGLPSYGEIRLFVQELLKTQKVPMESHEVDSLVKACQGLTLKRIELTLQKAVVNSSGLSLYDIELVLEEKRQAIKKTEVLDFYPVDEDLDDIGGLYSFKEWVAERKLAFSQKAADYGLPFPKGILMAGIQGTGKSLSAKVIAHHWRMPLLKLDIGRLMGSFVGESEARTRQMIRMAEAMAPCVVWIDEIDKAFAGMRRPQGDSGTSARVFGTIITWMQEKKAPVFVVATANNIENLPPELLRKGRFDEIFFVNLPNYDERKAIFEVHLKRKRNDRLDSFDTSVFAEMTEGYSGAEIEQLIVDAMFEAFGQSREFTGQDIIESIRKLIPLSCTAREQIDKLRKWAEGGRARDASACSRTKAG